MSVLNSLPERFDSPTVVRATVSRIVDADTVDVLVRNHNGQTETQRVRFSSIDALEKQQSFGSITGMTARDALASYLPEGTQIDLSLLPKRDTYGRFIGAIHKDGAPSTEYAHDYLVRNGYATVYEKYAPDALAHIPGALDRLRQAQVSAQTERLNMWTDGPAGKPGDEYPAVYRSNRNHAGQVASQMTAVRLDLLPEDGEQIVALTVHRTIGGKIETIPVSETSRLISDALPPGTDSAEYSVRARSISGDYEQQRILVSTDEITNNKFQATVRLKKGNRTSLVRFVINPSDVEGSLVFDGQEYPLDGAAIPASYGEYSYTVIPSQDSRLPPREGKVTINEPEQTVPVDLVSDSDPEAAAIVSRKAEEAAAEPTRQQLSILGSMELEPVDPETQFSGRFSEGYYTSVQTRMYINGLFIDELNSVQWQLNENVIPLYGWCSRDADAYAQGRALIQGQIFINYVFPWYLGTAITHQAAATLKRESDAQAAVAARLIASRAFTAADAARFGPETLALARRQVLDRNFSGTSQIAVYKRSVFDVILQFGDDRNNRRILRKCKVTSCDQVVDQSGNIIGESYGFIARDVE